MDFYSEASSRPFTHGQISWIFAANANDFYEIVSCFYGILKDAQATHALFAFEGTKNEKKP